MCLYFVSSIVICFESNPFVMPVGMCTDMLIAFGTSSNMICNKIFSELLYPFIVTSMGGLAA